MQGEYLWVLIYGLYLMFCKVQLVVLHLQLNIYTKNNRWTTHAYTECPKIYRKSVLHLLKYKFVADAVHICGKFWDT